MKRSYIILTFIVAVVLVAFPTPHLRTRQERFAIVEYVTKDEFDRLVEEARLKGYYVEVRIGEEPLLWDGKYPHVIGSEYRTVEYTEWLPWWIP